MTVFVDTSALIAHLDAEDHRHAEASATLEWLRRTADLVTTNYVAVECLAVCRRRLGRDAVVALIDELLPVLNVIWVNPQINAAAVATYRSGRSAASLVDEVSFGVMRSGGISEAFAFDDDFDREGFKRAVPPTSQGRVHEEPAPYGVDMASDLVSVAEIADRAGRPVNTVQSWRRRYADFPAPLADLAAGPIWGWPIVASWIASRSNARSSGQLAGRGIINDRLPGADIVRKGLADLSAERESVEGLLLQSAPERLAAIGIPVPGSPNPQATARMYELLEAEVGEAAAHGRYNALRRRLVSFLDSAGSHGATTG